MRANRYISRSIDELASLERVDKALDTLALKYVEQEQKHPHLYSVGRALTNVGIAYASTATVGYLTGGDAQSAQDAMQSTVALLPWMIYAGTGMQRLQRSDS